MLTNPPIQSTQPKHPHLIIYIQFYFVLIYANVFVEVSEPDFITYLNQTLTFDWCEIECESKSKHQEECG